MADEHMIIRLMYKVQYRSSPDLRINPYGPIEDWKDSDWGLMNADDATLMKEIEELGNHYFDWRIVPDSEGHYEKEGF